VQLAFTLGASGVRIFADKDAAFSRAEGIEGKGILPNGQHLSAVRLEGVIEADVRRGELPLSAFRFPLSAFRFSP